MPADLDAVVAAADAAPADVAAQIAAAYACDLAGDERRAVTYYDAAHRLGVPAGARAEFFVGYGSTLRNVGRLEEAVARLSAYLGEAPDDHAARCFLGLALHSAGRSAEALAELLGVALALRAGSPSITRYARALAEYRDELRGGPDPTG